MEMKAQTMADVVPICVAPIPSLLHENNIGVTRPSNFIMKPIRFVPLYFVAMPKSIITIIEPLFISTLIHTVDGVRPRTQTPKKKNF
jgi:hypothetical protein